jgi:Fic family protein
MQPPHPQSYERKTGATERAARDKRIMEAFFTGQYNIEELGELLSVSAATARRTINKHFKRLADKRERERSDEN